MKTIMSNGIEVRITDEKYDVLLKLYGEEGTAQFIDGLTKERSDLVVRNKRPQIEVIKND